MYKKLFKAYKRIYCFFRDMRLEWKLTCAYFIIIALPIVGTGLFINYTTTQSFINQSQLLMKQSLIQKEIINYKIDSIERTPFILLKTPKSLDILISLLKIIIEVMKIIILLFAPYLKAILCKPIYL